MGDDDDCGFVLNLAGMDDAGGDDGARKPKGNPQSRLEIQFGTPQHMHPKSSVSPRLGGQAQAQFFMNHVGKGA